MSRFSDNKFYYLLIGIAVVVVLSILHFVGVLKPVESLFVRGFSPVQSYMYKKGQGFSNFWLLVTSLNEINNENSDLRKNVETLMVEISDLKEVKNENKLLREQLGFSENNPLETIPALVVGSDPNVTMQFINIDRGKSDGVIIGKPAVTASGVLIGKVFEAESRSAKVLLLTDPNSSIVGITQDSRANGLINGEHGLALKMTTIPQDKDIISGDTIVTAGMEEGMPKGLLIGTIEEIISRDNELFKEATISPLADFKKIEMVFVVK